MHRAVRRVNAVDATLQALTAAVSREVALSKEFRKTAKTLLKFATYANYYALTIPLAQIVTDTITLREQVLKSFALKPREAKYAELIKAPYVNAALFPGCTKKKKKNCLNSWTNRNRRILSVARIPLIDRLEVRCPGGKTNPVVPGLAEIKVVNVLGSKQKRCKTKLRQSRGLHAGVISDPGNFGAG
jgi:hypothetical protein